MIFWRRLLISAIFLVIAALAIYGLATRKNRVGMPGKADLSSEDVDASSAPEFTSGTWINSESLTLKGLRGRVVLVEFWTFACYNCRNTLPSIKLWDTRYRDKGLTVVGVHTPELDQERDLNNVRREVTELGIRYPVVTDNDYAIWKAYGVDAWPTMFVIDKAGRIRGTHVGEGAYEETEQLIQRLLAEPPQSSLAQTK